LNSKIGIGGVVSSSVCSPRTPMGIMMLIASADKTVNVLMV